MNYTEGKIMCIIGSRIKIIQRTLHVHINFMLLKSSFASENRLYFRFQGSNIIGKQKTMSCSDNVSEN